MKFIKINAPFGEFELQDAPVTQGEYEQMIGTNPSRFKEEYHPVEMVSWDDTQKFIQELNKRLSNGVYIYRLPTEQEFEFAMGHDPAECELSYYAWYCINSDLTTHPVKQKLPNEFGLYDMRGNVWEWTSSLYDESGSYRVIRGGSWDNVAQYLRSAYRDYDTPGGRYDNVGFRLARTTIDSLTLNRETKLRKWIEDKQTKSLSLTYIEAMQEVLEYLDREKE